MTPDLDSRPSPPASTSGRRSRAGWWLLTVALLSLVVLSFVPVPYVIEQPGPVFNTLGTVEIDDEEVQVIETDAETYPTSGELDMLTVSVVGSRETRPFWLSVAGAWADQSRSVFPLDSVYPRGYSFEDSQEASRVQMESSQDDAIAAALLELGYEVPSSPVVSLVVDGAPAAGVLEVGDVLISANGDAVTDLQSLQDVIRANGADDAITFSIERDGEPLEVEVTPTLSDGADPVPIIGVDVIVDYDFPIDVSIHLDDVGGPSAGMMFALGIIDTLTPGAMTGGEHIAGTGTITSAGEVGAIGGIRQKLYGARDAGADWFLAPESNCDEVVGNIPSGITVFSVDTLDAALAAVDAIAGGDTEELAVCS